MNNSKTKKIPGTYRKMEVWHYLNEETGLNVMFYRNNKSFLSVWKLNPNQLKNLKIRGAL
jgi:Colicin D